MVKATQRTNAQLKKIKTLANATAIQASITNAIRKDSKDR
jgi:hypothetical protein